jgi:hypothetical protein
MAGLLGIDYLSDDPNQQAAQKAGLINFGAQMLLNSNRGFGGALGAGLLGGTEGYTNAYRNAIDMQQKQQTADLTKQLFGEVNGTSNASPAYASQAAPATVAQNGATAPAIQGAQPMGGMQASQPAPGGLTLPTLQKAAILGMKNVEPLFNMYKYKNDGIERKAGTWYQDPTTGQMQYIQDPK